MKMRNYMLVFVDEKGETCAIFRNTYRETCDTRMNIECGLGKYAEMYVYTEENGYILID